MALDFFSPQTGDPINTKRRVAQQAVRGVPAISGFVDFRSNGGPIAITPSEIDRLVIANGAAPGLNLAGKVTLGNGPYEMGDLDPADPGLINFLGNVYGKYTLSHEGSNTYWRWLFGLDRVTSAAPFLTLLNDDDVLPRYRIIDQSLGGYTLEASPNSNLAISFPVVSGDYDFHGIVTLTGTGPAILKAKRTWSGNWDTADKDIYVKVMDVTNIADGTDPRIDVQVKTGAAGTYGNTQTIHLGKWNRLYDETNAMYGKRAEQVLVRLEVGEVAVATDVWKIPQRRATWAQSLGAEYPISSINAMMILDGDEIRVEGGWSLEVAYDTNEAVADVYGRQGYTVQRSGKLRATLSLNRRLVDLTLQKKIHEAETASAIIDAVTDSNIPGATVPFRFLQVMPLLRATGTMFDTESGGTNRDEALTLHAAVPSAPLSYGGISFGSHINTLVETSVATFAG